jgi:hypothetical protein
MRVLPSQPLHWKFEMKCTRTICSLHSHHGSPPSSIHTWGLSSRDSQWLAYILWIMSPLNFFKGSFFDQGFKADSPP